MRAREDAPNELGEVNEPGWKLEEGCWKKWELKCAGEHHEP